MYNGETTGISENMLVDKQLAKKPLSYEYIRGLTDGEGCFTFYPANFKKSNGDIVKRKIPAFAIRMHVRDMKLIEMVKETLELGEKVHAFRAWRNDGYNRGDNAALIVRRLGDLKNIIVPFFYRKLKGYKGKQFLEWLENIGNDPLGAQDYKLIYRLYKCGYYDKNPKFD